MSKSVTDAHAAADVFQSHRNELGFVNRAQCEDGDLVIVERDDDIVGALLGNHCVRKPQSTVYELAVLPENRREGIATELIDQFIIESPHNKLVAKCPEPLPSNQFYESTGWKLVTVEDGKNRSLNVWELVVTDEIDVITTGRYDLTAIAEQYGWLRGARLDAIQQYESHDIQCDFVDLHWDDPDFDELLNAVQRHRPKYAVAGDYDEESDNYDVINERATQLRRYVDNVIVVPHEPNEVDIVPEWCIVGYSTPSKYAGTNAPVWEYYDRTVHILGGTIPQIRDLYGYLKDEIVSIDCNSFHRGATSFAKWWGSTTPQWNLLAEPITKPSNTIRAYENSMLNVSYALRQEGIVQ